MNRPARYAALVLFALLGVHSPASATPADRTFSDVPSGPAEAPELVRFTLVPPSAAVRISDGQGHTMLTGPREAAVAAEPKPELVLITSVPCFASKEEFLDAWDAAGETPAPVFCDPTPAVQS